jgi:RNA polymerase sigma-70 factor (ECF subfamily)
VTREPPRDPEGDQPIDEAGRLLVAARDDPAAYSRFYELHSTRVLAYFYRRVLCPHTAAELAAETFAEAFSSRHRFDPASGRGSAWLFGIAGNLYRQWLRRAKVSDRARRRLGIQMPRLVEEDYDRIEQLVDLTELRAGVREALVALSPKLRDAVLLRVALDLPYDEVAQLLGCSVAAARVRVSRGLDGLQGGLEVPRS